MIDTDKYEGHSMAWGLDPDDWTWAMNMFTAAGKTNEVDALLIQDAPLLVAEVERLQKEVDQLSIDVCESLELILDAYHPEVKDSVMSMFGDAIGNNWPYYGTLE